jgi:hypothetical protein
MATRGETISKGKPMPIIVRAKPVITTMAAVHTETMIRDLQPIG